ncbi:MAG: kelch repeat-containing protein [Thermoplasmata archaeon]
MNENKIRGYLSACLGAMLMLSFVLATMPIASAALQTTWEYETPLMADQTQSVFIADRANGNIYIIGGADGVIPGFSYKKTSNNVTVYNVATGQSHHLSPLPTGTRAAGGGLGEDGRIYIFGGYNDSMGTTLGYTQIYDIATDTWTLGASMPTASGFTSCAVIWPKFYVISGTTTIGVQVYDASTDSWSSAPSLPEQRVGSTAIFNPHEYAIFVIGGGTWFDTASDTVYKWYPWSSAWTTVSPLPMVRSASAATVGEDGLIYVAGGSNMGYNVGGDVFAEVFCYNSENDTWFSISSLNLPRKYLGLVSMPDGMIFAIGGNNKTTIFPTVESLNPLDETVWLSASSVETGDYLFVNFELESAYAIHESSSAYYYIKSSTGVVYPWNWIDFPAGLASLPIEIPVSMPIGSYELHIYWEAYFDTDGYWDIGEKVLAFSVIQGTQLSDLYDQLDNLQEQIDAIQEKINALNSSLYQNTDDLQEQIDAIQEKLNALNSSLYQNTDDLQEQIDAIQEMLNALDISLYLKTDDLKEQIDAVQEKLNALDDSLYQKTENLSSEMDDLGNELGQSVDDAANAANSANMMAMLAMILALIAVILIALNLVMSMRKKS